MPQEVSWGRPRPERADAARNRQVLLATARSMLADCGPDRLTMDGLAERSGLGKGTVFRRFGTRAGIFQALLDDSEREFQERVLSGPPPLGPGAPAIDRLVAYGQARIEFLTGNRELALAAMIGRTGPPGPHAPLSLLHIRVLLGQAELGPADLDVLAAQLAAALDGPLLGRLWSTGIAPDLGAGWAALVHRVCRP